MESLVDARGLLCPEPVLMVKREMERLGGKGRIKVLVDSGASKENISRLAKSQGWTVTISGEGPEFTLLLEKV
ncbi:SirA family protein [Ammonifex degensii KC4]|uniref:SirA family protein n=1 Tax=Ammonifex degensii (strain DSM 10501 / KC4) TaxID=429009 RepID=C9RA31_AMMDK|nr:sulfurtransferase TusA family protein [Ammonifex degensii]ACX53160.1 SirA family protein [Ammonifex degensii KC4]